jgi:L-threonylcarbamoyladenylate synthase
VELVLDGGQTTVGIESTVVDATGPIPRILRPGMISHQSIARVAGAAELASAVQGEVPRSPGLMGRHYAPRGRVVLFGESTRGAAMEEARRVAEGGGRVGAITFEALGPARSIVAEHVMPKEPESYARALYATMHAMDDLGCNLILIQRPPGDTEDGGAQWTAVIDRLERAAR